MIADLPISLKPTF